MFRRSAALNSSNGRVFSTSFGLEPGAPGDDDAPAQDAEGASRECASLEITSGTPRSRASRAWTSLRSSRSTWQLISSATPCRAAASTTASMSNGYGSRLQNPPAGRVAEDVDVRVLDRAQQPIGHLLAILIERRVDRGDDDVEGGQAVVGEVQRAVGPDVALDAGQQPHAGDCRRARGSVPACASARRSSRPLAIASDWL